MQRAGAVPTALRVPRSPDFGDSQVSRHQSPAGEAGRLGMSIAAFLRSWSQSIDRFNCEWGRVDDPAFLYLLAWWCSEDSQRTFLLLAVPSTDVHPARWASFAVGWGYFVIDRRYARRPKGVHVTQRALVMAFGLGDLRLSQSRNRCGGKQ